MEALRRQRCDGGDFYTSSGEPLKSGKAPLQGLSSGEFRLHVREHRTGRSREVSERIEGGRKGVCAATLSRRVQLAGAGSLGGRSPG
jgi:hypothetical protein